VAVQDDLRNAGTCLVARHDRMPWTVLVMVTAFALAGA
jgi:hypothetical protein